MSIVAFLLVALLLAGFGGLLAAADAAILSLSRADILELAATSRPKRSLRAIAEQTDAHLNAVNFARVVSEMTAAVFVTIALSFGIDVLWLALLLSALIMTAVSFVLVGSSPRSVGRVRPREVLRWAALPVHVVRVILGPIAHALVAIGDRVTPGRPGSGTFASEEQLLSMVDEATELAVLEEDDRELIHSIIEFNDTVVREVMIPRTDMVTVGSTETVGHALGLFLSRGVSRMPVVVGDDADDVVGVLYLRDAARLSYERPETIDSARVESLMRPAVFVPESKKVDDTLRQMQAQSNHLAMVVDEYGGIAGLVTLEDLIEELVGDISDEYDHDTDDVTELGDGAYRVSARLPVDELGELFGLELDDDDVDTVGGLVAKLLGRLPVTGSTVEVAGLVLTADRVEGRRKQLVSVVARRADGSDEEPTAEQSKKSRTRPDDRIEQKEGAA
ncbi:membrane protein [Cnuibacter physcomitrellae]|uniref:Hemolysin n=1 Tax=Cnuibacter physcomitrellae TaxID=1619308 RepID=A0A1X9LKX6_9MICO|nr:hemolysin family protein [Cnuibacter physcomitrellae]ARJ04948.1 hemolysin [Cnuibacter physcomitrellae]MCS5499169.1 hemolysin family protein [Cnuibacter physcomitrellae]GGI41508.1 membrane protein [Cnuibacter physcomitrellae]